MERLVVCGEGTGGGGRWVVGRPVFALLNMLFIISVVAVSNAYSLGRPSGVNYLFGHLCVAMGVCKVRVLGVASGRYVVELIRLDASKD